MSLFIIVLLSTIVYDFVVLPIIFTFKLPVLLYVWPFFINILGTDKNILSNLHNILTDVFGFSGLLKFILYIIEKVLLVLSYEKLILSRLLASFTKLYSIVTYTLSI